MATPLTDAIEALTTYANEITGQSDTDLSAAVATLTAGYGAGGGDLLDYGWPSGAYSNSTVTSIAISAFEGRTGITSISLPAVTALVSRAFANCTALETLNLPRATSPYGVQNVFLNCTSLKGIVLPAVSDNMYYGCFSGCSSLEYFDSFASGFLQGDFFKNCSSLATLILRRTAGVVSLAQVGSLNGTPFASGGTGGTIYVPSALISSYQSASNWSTIDGYGTVTWKAIEGSIYETQYADGTPISTEE